MDILSKLAFKYGTDKTPEIKHPYTPFYYELLKDKRETIKTVLELGIGTYDTMQHVRVVYDPRLKRDYHRGASLKMWRDFFPNAQIYGADITKESMFKGKRITTLLCDERKKKDLEGLVKKVGDIDLFVDDGSHVTRHQIFTALTLRPLIKRDAIYIIEDVRDSGLEYLIKALKDNGLDYIHPRLKRLHRDDNLIIVKR